MAWIWIHSATTLLLKRQPFLASHLVVCSCCLGLRWLFIPSLLVLKVSCTIIPDYSTGKWQATTLQHSVKVVRVMLFMWHTCFFLVWFSFFLNISTFSKPNPNHILASVWACFECVSSISLISTWACCLLLRRSGSENKQSSSYLAWAGKVDSAEQTSWGVRGGRVQDWAPMASTWMSRELNQTPQEGWAQVDSKIWIRLIFLCVQLSQ